MNLSQEDFRRSRKLLRVGLVTSIMAMLVLYSGCRSVYSGPLDTRHESPMDNTLQIPELLTPTRTDSGERYDLYAQEGTTEFMSGVETSTWGYNGSYLGPTLRVTRGDDIHVRVHNELDEKTTLHWHGAELPGPADGGPHQVIASGGSRDIRWTVDQPAATLWYHPHTHGRTGFQVYQGLSGLLLVEDHETPAEVPSQYGVNDIPLIVQDRAFRRNGEFQFRAPSGSMMGVIGDVILVNGTPEPHVEVSHSRVRFRLLNGSNGRVYNFLFEDSRSFQVIASDGGFLPRPIQVAELQLSPGERAEIVVSFEPGERVRLQSGDVDMGMGFPLGPGSGEQDYFDILEVRAADNLAAVPRLPDRLAPDLHELPNPSGLSRRFELGRFATINGRTMDMERIDFSVSLGDREIWTVRNGTDTYHNFHVHGVQFRILDLDGYPPPPHFAGWKDTVQLKPGTTARLSLTFKHPADESNPFMYHCHILAHEDAGMMGQFTVR